NDGEAQLHAQDHLAEDEQLSGTFIAENKDREECGNYCDQACQYAPDPWLHTKVEVSLHHYLACKGAGDGAALSCGDKSHREKHRGYCAAKHGRKELVSILNFNYVMPALHVKSGSGKDQDS